MIEEKLYQFLRATLEPVIGDRLYAVIAPQGVIAPFCVYRKVNVNKHYSQSGYSGLDTALIQVSCFAESYSEVKRLAELVVTELEKSRFVQAVFVTGESDEQLSRSGLFHVPIDFSLWDRG